MEEKLPELPEGWEWVRVSEVIEKVSLTGKKLKRKNYDKEGKIPVIDQGKELIGGYTNKEDLQLNCQLPVIIFGDHTKVVKYIDFNFVVGAEGVKVIRPLSLFLPKLFYYFIQIVPIPDRGYSRHFQFVEKASMPLPPLLEQSRIVDKIEELFSRLDAGIESLKKVQAQIKRYRQAVLKHAFEGSLTAAWREANKQRLKPASTLLERKKEGKKQKKSGKQKELTSLDTSSLHSIPVMWKWAKVGEVCYLMQYGTSEKASKSNTGYPILRMGNIQNGSILFDDLKYMPKEWKKANDFILQRGDILFNRTNSAELVGKSAVFKNYHLPVVFASYLIRVRTKIDPFYVSNYINSYYGRLYIASVVSQQVGQANVSATKLSNMSIPLPPLEEQLQIVEEIERRFSIVDRVEEIVEQNLKKAERLRQSILKKAFEGKLVSQDPTDEPASVLLERIKAEKEKNASNKKQCRRSKK